MIWLYVLLFSLLYYIVIRFIERKTKIRELTEKYREMLREYIESKKADLEFFNKYREIANSVTKYYLYMTIFSVAFLISFFSFFTSSFSLSVLNNSTIIKINNPILSNAEFFILYNSTNLGFYRAENSKIILNYEIKDKNLLSLDLVVFKLPFNLPIVNKNWIGYIFSFILFSIAISLIDLFIVRRAEKKFIKNISFKTNNGKENNNKEIS